MNDLDPHPDSTQAAALRLGEALQALGRAIMEALEPVLRRLADALSAIDRWAGTCTCGAQPNQRHRKSCRGWLWRKTKHPGPDAYKRHLREMERDTHRRYREAGYVPVYDGRWPRRQAVAWRRQQR